MKRDADLLKVLDPYIGRLTLYQVHMGTLRDYIHERRQPGRVHDRENTFGRRVRAAGSRSRIVGTWWPTNPGGLKLITHMQS